MTDPTVTHRFEGNGVVADAPSDLSAIQDSYERAKANIVDPALDWSLPADEGEPLPATEKIDVRTVDLPAVPARIPGTTAMSVAARLVAEQLALEEGRERAPGRGRGGQTAELGRRGWWRSIRAALHGSAPATAAES